MSHTLNYTLKDRILEKIAKNDGRISFQDFMQSALYDPKAGFYTGNAIPLGKEGHFTTAPEISPLFGECIAQQILPFFKSGTLDCILEFGPGRGKLALSVLRYLEAHNALPETYYFLDLSSTLKAEQQKCIQTQAPHLFERCQWLDKLPDTQLNACVLANEVLDAMPVTRFVIQEGELKEGYVGYSDDALIEIPRPPQKALRHRVSQLPELPEGYQSEMNLFIQPWLQSLYDCLNKGLVLLFDYGFAEEEYYHPDRREGTIMCHHQHKAHPNPFIHIGEQDITAHVDFSHVAFASDEIGFDVKGYTTQAAFLLANGITDNLDDSSEETRFNANQAIKILTLPQEMGELFKAMALTKNIEEPLSDFALIDLRRQL